MLMDADAAFLVVIDMQERLLPAMKDNALVEHNCSILMQTARQLALPTVVSEQYPKGLGRTVQALADLAPEGSVFPKVEFSCARDPNIMAHIEGWSRKQAILCGVEAHICVLQTALDLKQCGYDVFVAVDATSSRADPSKEIARDRMIASDITVVTTEMVVFELVRSAAAPQFKTLSKLIQ